MYDYIKVIVYAVSCTKLIAIITDLHLNRQHLRQLHGDTFTQYYSVIFYKFW